MMRPRFASLVGDTNAAAGAEMALILPMAFALIFTTMEAGYYFQTEHKAVKYVREGARYAARMNFKYYDCSGSGAFQDSTTPGAPSAATIQSQITNVTLTGFPSNGSTRIADWDASDVHITVTCDADYGTGLYAGTTNVKAPIVTVWTRFPYPSLLGQLGFDVTNTQIVAQSQAAVIGI